MSSRTSVGGFFNSQATAPSSHHKRSSIGGMFGGVHSRSSAVGVIDEDEDFDCFGEEKVAEMDAEPAPKISLQPVQTSPRRSSLEQTLSSEGFSHSRRATA